MRQLLGAKAVFAVMLLCGPVAWGQEVLAPTLSDVQKLQLLNASKDVEMLELRLQYARETLQRMILGMTPAGYRITDKLELVPLPKEDKK